MSTFGIVSANCFISKFTVFVVLSFFLSFFQLPDVEISLDDPKATIFSYVQKVVLAAGLTKNERVRRVWEPTYT